MPGEVKYNGCKQKQTTTITSTGIQIVDVVYLQTNRVVMLAKSFDLPDNVVDVFNSHPEMPAVVVEGHTDDRGDQTHNIDLSRRRADAGKNLRG